MGLIYAWVDAWLVCSTVGAAVQVIIFSHGALGKGFGIGTFHNQLYLRLEGRGYELP